MTVAHVAQSAEHILGKDEVNGSIPFVGLCPCKCALSITAGLEIKSA